MGTLYHPTFLARAKFHLPPDGVATAIVIEFALGWMRQQSILAAKAEMEQLILATQKTPTKENIVNPSSTLSSGTDGYSNINTAIL